MKSPPCQRAGNGTSDRNTDGRLFFSNFIEHLWCEFQRKWQQKKDLHVSWFFCLFLHSLTLKSYLRPISANFFPHRFISKSDTLTVFAAQNSLPVTCLKSAACWNSLTYFYFLFFSWASLLLRPSVCVIQQS